MSPAPRPSLMTGPAPDQPLAARRVVPFVNPRVPKVALAAPVGKAPRVFAPRRAPLPAAPARRDRIWTGAMSALAHVVLVGLALGQTTGALSSGNSGVLEVTLVAALPSAVAAPEVPVAAPAPVAPPTEDNAVPLAPTPPDRQVPMTAIKAPVAPPAADAPVPAVAPALATRIAVMTAPPAEDGSLPPPPAATAPPRPDVAPDLQAPNPAEVQPVAEAAPPPPPEPKPVVKPRPKPAEARPAEAGGKARGAGAGAAAGAGGAAALTTGAGADRSALASWGAGIMAGVERHKRFPVAAGDARGTVGVALTVARDGALAGVRVAKSSGVAALDLAAVQAVQAAAPFPPAPAALGEPSYSFTLMVKFGG